MSVQIGQRHMSPAANPDLLPMPKKRKHDGDSKDSPKKKKKKQQQEAAESPVAVTITPTSDTSKKAKRKKARSDTRDLDADTPTINGDHVEAQDHELPDFDIAEQHAVPEVAEQKTDNLGLEIQAIEELEQIADLLGSADPTSFYSTRLSLYVSIPAISLESSTSSILATHLAPLLLTYFPAAEGIVLGFSDPVLSAKPQPAVNLPLQPPQDENSQPQTEVLARTADEFGVCWVWLTATLLVFRPKRGDELYGWTNVMSEGFVGLVSYNYFQTAVGRSRIPEDWIWNGPTRDQERRTKKGKKGRLRDEDGLDQSQENGTQEDMQEEGNAQTQSDDAGFFSDKTGVKIPQTLKFRVLDTEVVPAHDRHKWSLQIDGTLLDDEAEKRAVEDDRAKFDRAQQRSRSQTPRDIVMTGALGFSRENSVVSRISGQAPARHRVAY
jgi:DNA-directed RNA polymerase I subunit RPA43